MNDRAREQGAGGYQQSADASAGVRETSAGGTAVGATQRDQARGLNLEQERQTFARFLGGKHVLAPGAKGAEVEAVQHLLNDWRAQRGLEELKVSGVYDKATRQAVKTLQFSIAINSDGTVSVPKQDQEGNRLTGLQDDGIFGVRSLYALRKSLEREDQQSFQQFAQVTHGVYDISHVRQKWLATDLDIPAEVRTRLHEHVRKAGLSEEFLRKNEEIAAKHGASGDEFLVYYYAENKFKTGRHHPNNPQRTDTGLIGFTEETAKRLGTSTAALAKMSNVQQLEYVDKYFTMWEKQLGTHFDSPADRYMTIHRPKLADDSDNVMLRIGGRGPRIRKGDVPDLLYKRV